MIEVTRLNGKKLVVNSDLIETMEATPDTVITLTGGNKYVVVESTDELIRKVTEYKRFCHPLFREGEIPKE
ncbi:MAG: flagellar FlbD family protein [Desulfitobacterium sp.]